MDFGKSLVLNQKKDFPWLHWDVFLQWWSDCAEPPTHLRPVTLFVMRDTQSWGTEPEMGGPVRLGQNKVGWSQGLTSHYALVYTSEIKSKPKSKLEHASESSEALLKHWLLGPSPSVWFSRSGWGPKNLHFEKIPRECQCCRSREHTLRTITLNQQPSLVFFSPQVYWGIADNYCQSFLLPVIPGNITSPDSLLAHSHPPTRVKQRACVLSFLTFSFPIVSF